jgi:D-serine deaminase-like pyridoxal phosphate-dependent protein
MGYEAQIAGVGDATPGQGAKNLVIRWLKNRSAREIQKRRADTVNALKDKGRELSVINGGGTGSLEWTRQETSVTEVTAGSGFFHPSLFDNYTNFQHQPAAGFAIEITRKPAAGIYTCAGGGYIASGAPGPDKAPKPWLPEGAELLANEGAGEVQTPVYYDGKEQLRLGDPIFLRHAKAGELCERFQELHLLSEGRLLDTVPTYRGEGQCFL